MLSLSQFFQLAKPLFEHVGLQLVRTESDVAVKFCIPYPLHVYSKIADAVASSVSLGVI